MDGKAKCKILKQIRKQIADNNGIPFVVEECPYKGKCKGTCPRCEEELQYLERELAKRKKVKIALVAGGAAAAVTLSGVIFKDKIEAGIRELTQPMGTTGAVSAQDLEDLR